MTAEQLTKALARLKVETGSLACLGCGYAHNCSTRGCYILREAERAIADMAPTAGQRWMEEKTMRPIDANALYDKVEQKYKVSSGSIHSGYREFLDMICDAPTVDAVEVVRCKDCQHGVFDAGKGVWKCVESAEWDEVTGDWIGVVIYRPRDFYCANGERRSE